MTVILSGLLIIPNIYFMISIRLMMGLVIGINNTISLEYIKEICPANILGTISMYSNIF